MMTAMNSGSLPAMTVAKQRHVLLFGDGFQNFQHALFHPHASLHALNNNGFAVLLFFGIFSPVMLVTMYQDTYWLSNARL